MKTSKYISRPFPALCGALLLVLALGAQARSTTVLTSELAPARPGVVDTAAFSGDFGKLLKSIDRSLAPSLAVAAPGPLFGPNYWASETRTVEARLHLENRARLAELLESEQRRLLMSPSFALNGY